ncbi:MAG TPA: hypothetical protein VFA01_05815 [Candidatus Dormibacteraeota bacterium]|jgi:hypothetical protein|nr:hypothetical protein [Candidatus Dormibacteraeota bacterium]
MRRAIAALAVVALLLGVAAIAGAQDARGKFDGAVARTNALRYVHFEMRGAVRADSPNPAQAPAGGILRQELTATGDIAFPDRLHLSAPLEPDDEPRELLVVGDRAWSRIGGVWRRIVAGGARTDPRALVEMLSGSGAVSFVGYDVVGLVPTYHLRMELDAAALAERQARIGDTGPPLEGSGRLDVYVGILDGRIHRQQADILEQTPEDLGSGLYRVRTSYAVDYSAFDRPVDIREPSGQ